MNVNSHRIISAICFYLNAGIGLIATKCQGIINQVYIKSTREAVLSDPSGITYAIPVQHLINLLEQPN